MVPPILNWVCHRALMLSNRLRRDDYPSAKHHWAQVGQPLSCEVHVFEMRRNENRSSRFLRSVRVEPTIVISALLLVPNSMAGCYSPGSPGGFFRVEVARHYRAILFRPDRRKHL